MKNSRILVATVIAVFLMVGSAMAVQVLPGSEKALQTILNDITVGGDSSINVNEDQLLDTIDSTWAITASGGSIATFIIEIAGYAGINQLGVYDVADSSKKVTIFSGADTKGAQSSISIKEDGSVFKNFGDTGIDFAGNNFGYYLTTPYYTFYSDSGLNADGFDHMVAFQGNDSDMVQLPGLAAGVWTDNEFILAWEDLYNGGDQDFNDLVIMVESVNPVPEPGTMVLLGLGLIGVAAYGRKKNLFRK